MAGAETTNTQAVEYHNHRNTAATAVVHHSIYPQRSSRHCCPVGEPWRGGALLLHSSSRPSALTKPCRAMPLARSDIYRVPKVCLATRLESPLSLSAPKMAKQQANRLISTHFWVYFARRSSFVIFGLGPFFAAFAATPPLPAAPPPVVFPCLSFFAFFASLCIYLQVQYTAGNERSEMGKKGGLDWP